MPKLLTESVLELTDEGSLSGHQDGTRLYSVLISYFWVEQYVQRLCGILLCLPTVCCCLKRSVTRKSPSSIQTSTMTLPNFRRRHGKLT